MPIDVEKFKEIMSRFATGVTVVTTKAENQPFGLTVSAFCSVSLSPPLILICVNKAAHSHDALRRAATFAVNILSEQQEALSNRFADPELTQAQRFAGLACDASALKLPVLPGIIGYMDCRRFKTYDGGDHTIILGEVFEMRLFAENAPLLCFNRQYRQLYNDNV